MNEFDLYSFAAGFGVMLLITIVSGVIIGMPSRGDSKMFDDRLKFFMELPAGAPLTYCGIEMTFRRVEYDNDDCVYYVRFNYKDNSGVLRESRFFVSDAYDLLNKDAPAEGAT